MSSDINYFDNIPPEIIEYILSFQDISIKDALKFALTCPHNLELCQSFQSLWKRKLFLTWPTLKNIFDGMTVGNWFAQCQEIGKTQFFCSNRIKGMESTYHWREVTLPQDDMKDLLDKSKESDGLHFHFMAEYLRRVCYVDVVAPDKKDQIPQYGLNSLTNKYYAEIVLDYLSHEHLKVDLQALLYQVFLPEEIAVLFIQWILPKTRITKSITSNYISTLVEKVELLLDKNHPLHSVDALKRKQWSTILLKDNQWDPKTSEELIRLISFTLTQTEKFAVTGGYSWDNINIEKVISDKAGHQLMLNILFEGIARRCGVRCDLVTTANHVFLYWRSNWSESSPLYVINTENGSMKPSVGRCPFSTGNSSSRPLYQYSHLQLMVTLLLIFDGIHELMGERMSLYCFQLLQLLYPDNTTYLMAIINYHYKNRLDLLPLLPMIEEHLLNPNVPDDRKSYCRQAYNEIVTSIKMSSRFLNREKRAMYRPDRMKYGIGLICKHRTHQYDCVIVNWKVALPSVPFEPASPHGLIGDNNFYYVVAQDNSCRKVLEDELQLDTCSAISRLPSVEGKIGKDFSHFNGFRYIPNEEKRNEYPEDEMCCFFYQNRYFRSRRTLD